MILPVIQVGPLPLEVVRPRTQIGQTVSQVVKGNQIREGLPQQGIDVVR